MAVDFDNTLFMDAYPFVGEVIEGAVEVINSLYNKGWTIIINTCREGEMAENAILALEEHGFKYSFFNNNDPVRTAKYGYDSRKIGSDLIIDNAALPLALTGIDWEVIEEMMGDFEDIWTANQSIYESK